MISLVKSNKLSILLYHGVTREKSFGIENRFGKHMPEKQFIEQMNWLKNNCNVLSMDQVVEHHICKKSYPKNAVAITFDDGFENNYSVAAPILNDLSLPATFYITSGLINADLMFWVDKLEDCLNSTKKTEIMIKMEGNDFDFELSTEDLRYNALFIIKQYCKNCSNEEKELIVKQVEEQTEITPDVSHSLNYKKLDWKILIEMYKNPLFIIGGHSLNHNVLSKLSYCEMEKDLNSSLEILRNNLGLIRHYSYPEGHPEHFNRKTVEILQQNGIICCPTAISGFNEPNTDLFLLRRNHTNLAKIY